jgi:hypothetical protein
MHRGCSLLCRTVICGFRHVGDFGHRPSGPKPDEVSCTQLRLWPFISLHRITKRKIAAQRRAPAPTALCKSDAYRPPLSRPSRYANPWPRESAHVGLSFAYSTPGWYAAGVCFRAPAPPRVSHRSSLTMPPAPGKPQRAARWVWPGRSDRRSACWPRAAGVGASDRRGAGLCAGGEALRSGAMSCEKEQSHVAIPLQRSAAHRDLGTRFLPDTTPTPAGLWLKWRSPPTALCTHRKPGHAPSRSLPRSGPDR